MSEDERMSMEYIRKYYGVPAKRGGLVRFEGQIGRITSARDAHLRILFPEMKRPLIFHPKSIEYVAAPLKEGVLNYG